MARSLVVTQTPTGIGGSIPSISTAGSLPGFHVAGGQTINAPLKYLLHTAPDSHQRRSLLRNVQQPPVQQQRGTAMRRLNCAPGVQLQEVA
ncbi:hypothetical protein GA0061093_103438 [Rhodococcus qingshengii]|nr:hypothetical protein GA0061093_103438 [Rhodococcus qingshengii]